jgi:hypothetical protein
VKEIYKELNHVQELMDELKNMQDLTLDVYSPDKKEKCEEILKELVQIQGEFVDTEIELNDMLLVSMRTFFMSCLIIVS